MEEWLAAIQSNIQRNPIVELKRKIGVNRQKVCFLLISRSSNTITIPLHCTTTSIDHLSRPFPLSKHSFFLSFFSLQTILSFDKLLIDARLCELAQSGSDAIMAEYPSAKVGWVSATNTIEEIELRSKLKTRIDRPPL